MPSRYSFNPIIGNRYFATSDMIRRVFNAVDEGSIPVEIVQIDATSRLDVIAFEAYGDSTLWWIIAAASGIGWPSQLAPGTYIRVPRDLNAIYEIMRVS